MNLEIIISLAIMIAVVELKEWRLIKRIEQLENRMSLLVEESQKIRAICVEQMRKLDFMEKVHEAQADNFHAIKQEIDEVKKLASSAESHGATILREYELNGIPLGYQRKQPDFVETL